MAYSPEEKTEIINKLCGLIIQTSVADACKQVGIAESTFYAWVASDDELSEQYTRARVAISYKNENEIESIAERASQGEMPSDIARVVIDAKKWLAGKRNPKVYGERTELNHTGGTTITVQLPDYSKPKEIAE